MIPAGGVSSFSKAPSTTTAFFGVWYIYEDNNVLLFSTVLGMDRHHHRPANREEQRNSRNPVTYTRWGPSGALPDSLTCRSLGNGTSCWFVLDQWIPLLVVVSGKVNKRGSFNCKVPLLSTVGRDTDTECEEGIWMNYVMETWEQVHWGDLKRGWKMKKKTGCSSFLLMVNWS